MTKNHPPATQGLNMLKLDVKNRQNFYQLLVGLIVVTMILIGCIVILAPFFPAILLATILTLATWPAFTWLLVKVKGRTALASGLMTLMLTACFILPIIVIGTSVADNYDKIYSTVQSSLRANPAVAAEKIRSVPYVGAKLENLWNIVLTDRERVSTWLQDHSGDITQFLLKMGKSIGYGLLDITLGVIIAYFLFRHGTIAAQRISALIDKFGGKEGERMLEISKTTLIGVVYGLLGTALAQGALGALGFWIADVPGAAFLGLIVFFFSLIPMGPPLIWVPAAIWLFSKEEIGMATFLALWGAFVIGGIDNIMKPYFISRGSNLPLMLVLLGVMGGVVAFGFIGLFIGPTLLALAYSLLMGWSSIQKPKAQKDAEQLPT
jgi:predicted PurR-regulated permease PerM